MTRLPARPLAAIAVAVVLWSTAFVASAFVLETASAAVLSVGRFAFALLGLLPFALRRPGLGAALRRPMTVLLGLTGVTLYYALANIGLQFTSAGAAALANAALPVIAGMLAVVLLRERLRIATAAGLLLATAGVAVASLGGLAIDGGMLLCIAGLAAYALYTVLLRRGALRGERTDPIVLGTATAIWGTVLLLPWLAVEALGGGARMPTDPGGIASLAYLGLVVTAPTVVLFNYGAERLPAAVSGVSVAGIPPIGYALALLLGEPLDPLRLVGGAVALGGVVLATVSSPGVEPAPAGAPVPPHP